MLKNNKKIKHFFGDWTKFEFTLLFGGIAFTLVLTILFDCSIIDFLYTLLYFLLTLFLAKGKYVCYIIGIISTFIYSYISYNNHYYGEIFISLFMTLPLMIFGLINWLKNQDNTNTVVIKEINKKELIILLLSQVIMFGGYYYLLKVFNTSNLIISTISIIASLIASYFTARRSEYGLIAYAINDLILIILWGIPVIKGDLTLVSVWLCPTLLLINDTYGIYNWKIIKKKQQGIKIIKE